MLHLRSISWLRRRLISGFFLNRWLSDARPWPKDTFWYVFVDRWDCIECPDLLQLCTYNNPKSQILQKRSKSSWYSFHPLTGMTRICAYLSSHWQHSATQWPKITPNVDWEQTNCRCNCWIDSCVLKIKAVLEVHHRLPFRPNPAGLNYYSRQQ